MTYIKIVSMLNKQVNERKGGETVANAKRQISIRRSESREQWQKFVADKTATLKSESNFEIFFND